jgi:hypothetical protein
MDTETANTLLVVSTTTLHVWLIYVSYYWFLNNCECI